MEKYDIQIGNEFVESSEVLIVEEKYTRTPFAQTFYASDEQIEKAINLGLKAFKEYKNISAYERSAALQSISRRLLQHKQEIATVLAKESGKPMKYATIEVERASQTFQIAADEAKRLHAEVIPMDNFPANVGKEAIVKRFPLGLVFGITPFNFPLNLVAHKVAPAIAIGCPIIIKPSSLTPLCALLLGELVADTGLPSGAISVLPMKHSQAEKLIADDRIKKISFTGSPEVGWNIKTNCRKKRITLELGGNAAAIVTPSADMQVTIPKCVTGAFAYSGQICIHTQRIYVHESKYKYFLEHFLEKARQWQYGNPLDSTTDISVLIQEKEAIRVEQWINEAIEQGAELLLGGKRQGSFIPPTILVNTNKNMKVWSHEVFGPTVIIEPYSDFSHAIELVNDTNYGLQAGVFTNNITEINQAFAELEVGGVMINETPTFRADHLPYGGIKDSGFGREGVRYAMEEMSELKVLVKPA